MICNTVLGELARHRNKNVGQRILSFSYARWVDSGNLK